jgi:arylsulfatase A-like enzyme
MSSNKQPNLIYVFADQLRYQSVGFAGDSIASTPRIDALAEDSVNFTNCVSGHPVCAPYRASLFTGKYSSSTGMVINELRMNPKHTCFGHVLHNGGYDTCYIGKWHLWANEFGNHHDPKNSYTPPGEYRLGFDGYWASYGFHHTYWNQYYHENSPKRITIEGYEPDGQTDLAISKLREASIGEKPFALFLSFGTPHDPWNRDNVPGSFYEMFRDIDFPLPPNYKPENDPHADDWARLNADERLELPEWMRVYAAMTANLDWNVGRLLDAVDELGLRENTIFVFTSDHGEMFGAQGRRAKNIFYDEAVRVPFLLRYPNCVPAGFTSDACLNTPDVMPTLLSLMNLNIPAGVEGMDLSHCVYGQDGAEPEAALMQGMGATAIFEDGHEWRALRSKRYTYAVYRVDGKELLFDNRVDPYQMTNLVNSAGHQPILTRLRDQLRQRLAELNDTFEACKWYENNWIDNRIITRTATLNS